MATFWKVSCRFVFQIFQKFEIKCENLVFSLFESSQSLFWASFGMVGLENFELEGIKSYTRFWGLLMFGSYSVINVIVLLNLLIAMMSNSYAMITVSAFLELFFLLFSFQIYMIFLFVLKQSENLRIFFVPTI